MGIRTFVISSLLGCLAFGFDRCEQETNCKLPNCFCPTFNHPLLNVSDIPQMVYFGFDDALTPPIIKIYNQLFQSNSVNPNGCRIGMTLYVSHQYTSYAGVKEFYDEGMEIASHSVHHNHIQTRDVLYREAKQQKENLVKHSHVPYSEITGWRSPFLETAGDDQPDVLKSLGYEYDISLTYNRNSFKNPNPWPFTADYGWPFRCQMKPCLSSKHPGFWEFPVNSMIDFKGLYPCNYLDGCMNRPSSEDEAFKYLMDNFKSAYNGNRAPLGIHAHAAWLETPHNFNAMKRFLRELSKNSEVYVLSVNKVLKWMQQPTSLRNILQFSPWQCGQSKETAEQKTSQSTKATSKTTTVKPTTSSTTTTVPTTTSTTTSTTTPTTTSTTTSTTIPTTTTTTRTTTTKATTTSKKSVTTLRRRTSRVDTENSSNSLSPQAGTNIYYPTVLKTTFKATPEQPNIVHMRTKKTNTVNPIHDQSKPITIQPASSGASRNNFGWSWIPINLFSNLRQKSKLSPFGGHESNNICVQGDNCKLPNCFCKGSSISDGLNNEATPQFVYMSFDGNIDSQVFYRYKNIFSGRRRNPDNCPISSTFFITQEGSRDAFISYFYNNSQEIALRGSTVSHYGSKHKMKKQLEEQDETLSKLGIKTYGWRSPELKPLGDEQFSILKARKITYDSTLVLQNSGLKKTWPFTLDFGWHGDCVISECPKRYYPGLWEVPNVPVMDYRNMYPCNYVDGCIFSPTTAEDTFQFLWNNFQGYYKSNKAPFGLSFRHNWFTHPSYRNNLKGFEMFLDKLVEMDDVYIVSIEKLIHWMKNPLSIPELLLRPQC